MPNAIHDRPRFSARYGYSAPISEGEHSNSNSRGIHSPGPHRANGPLSNIPNRSAAGQPIQSTA